MKLSKSDPHALTEDEERFLRSTTVPDEVQSFLARRRDTIGTRTTAYRKVAAAARAEREAIIEVRALDAVKETSEHETARRERIAALERENEALRLQSEQQRQAIGQLTARHALAVHSGE